MSERSDLEEQKNSRALSSPSIISDLHTVAFLKEKSLKELQKTFKLRVNKHPRYPNLLQFHYSQYGSPMKSPIVQECRGLILDEKNNWNIVAFPYSKFFNYLEPEAVSLDWSKITVYEKLDGSLAILYYYDNHWEVASSSRPDGGGILKNGEVFSELFWKTWKTLDLNLPTDISCCYIFELISPKNIIVVQPPKDRIVLHGVRNLKTLKELEPEPIANHYKWECVPTYFLNSLEDIIKACKSLNPIEQEGYVVRDMHWNRIKVKSPQYVALVHLNLKDTEKLNARHILEIIRLNEGMEFLTYFPSHTQLYNTMKNQYDKLVERLEKYISNEGTAMNVPGNYKAIVSKLMKQSEPSVFQTLRDMDIKELLKLIEMESTNKDEKTKSKLTQNYDQVLGRANKKKKSKNKNKREEDEKD